MGCDRYLELLALRLEEVTLTGEEEQELAEHLSRCPGCRAAGAQLAALRSAFDELEDESAPEDFTQGVMSRIQGRKAEKNVITWFRRPQFRALTGLAACVVLAVGLFGASRWQRQGETTMMQTNLDPGAAASVNEDPLPAPRCVPDRGDGNDPMIAAYASPDSAGEPVEDGMRSSMQKTAVDAFPYDEEPAAVGPEVLLVLERMPEGAEELIPPEVEVVVVDAGNEGDSTAYRELSPELLEQIEQIAADQGIGVLHRLEGEEKNGLCVLVIEEAAVS